MTVDMVVPALFLVAAVLWIPALVWALWRVVR
jgi:hypothetical protein